MARTRLISGLSFLLLLVITTSLIRRYDLTVDALFGVAPAYVHLAALMTVAVEIACRASRTLLLARGLRAHLGFGHALTVQVVADGAAAITPARVGSDPAKLLMLGRAGVDLPRSGVILVGEALSEAVALTLIALLFALIVRPHGSVALGSLAYVGTTASAVIIALILGGPQRKRVLRALPISQQRRYQLLQGMRHFASHARRLLTLPGAEKALIGLVAAAHICARVALLPILSLAVVPTSNLPMLAAWALTLLYAGSLVPLPLAGGLVELGFAAAFSNLIPPHALIAVLLWWRLYTFYLGALVGVVALWFARKPE